jgi:hypothetical protein
MKQPSRTPQIVFLLLGLLLLVIAYLLATLISSPSESTKFWTGSIQNIAFIVLTIVIVDFLWQIIGGEPVRETLKALSETLTEMRSSVVLLEDSKKTGIHRLFSVSGAFGSNREWMDRLKQARSNVDLLGYTLHVWTRGEYFEQEMIALVKAGVHVRILIMDEANPNLPSLVNEKQISSISVMAVKAEIGVAKNAFISIASTLGSQSPLGSFEFRTLKEGLIVSQICRTDSRLTAVQYLYSVVASRSPLVDVRGSDSELFKVYLHEFDSLWQLGTAP